MSSGASVAIATSMLVARDIMSTPVVTFFAEQTLPLAEDVMQFKHLRHLPVIDDDGKLVGLVSHRDHPLMLAALRGESTVPDARAVIAEKGQVGGPEGPPRMPASIHRLPGSTA